MKKRPLTWFCQRSEALRSKVSLRVSPAAPPGAGETCPVDKGRHRRPLSTNERPSTRLCRRPERGARRPRARSGGDFYSCLQAVQPEQSPQQPPRCCNLSRIIFQMIAMTATASKPPTIHVAIFPHSFLTPALYALTFTCRVKRFSSYRFGRTTRYTSTPRTTSATALATVKLPPRNSRPSW